MVKKQRNLRVWENQQKKTRKRRTPRPRQQLSQQSSIQEQVDENSMIQEMLPVAQNQQINHQQHSNMEEENEDAINNNSQIKQQSFCEMDDDHDWMDVLKKRLAIVKEVLTNDCDEELEREERKLIDYRPEQRDEISKFLRKNVSDHQTNSKLLFIYGVPGSGKTFLVKNILISQSLLENTKWINCLSILSKSSLKKSDNTQQTNKTIRYVVIDEFDQIQELLKVKSFFQIFRKYIEKIMSRGSPDSQPKFILISNKPHQVIDYKYINMIKKMINCDVLVDVPFFPYSLQSILNILRHRVKQINNKAGSIILGTNFVELAAKRIYSSTQDIRKIVNFILYHYEHQEKEQVLSNNDCDDKMKKQILTSEFNLEQTLQVTIIKKMNLKQKTLFYGLLKAYQQAVVNKQYCYLDLVYREGIKIQVNRHITDIWLKEWSEQGLLKLQQHTQKGHILYNLISLKTHISLKQVKRYFY